MTNRNFTESRRMRVLAWPTVKIVPMFLWLLFAGSAAAAATSPIEISSPQQSSTVSGPVRIVVEPQSADVVWVNVFVDGKYLASSPPYTFTWDSTRYSERHHTITATAYSAQGAYLGAVTTCVRVRNRAVRIILPVTGSIVSGAINVVTKVTDEADWINLSVDDKYVSSPDYNFSLDTTPFGDGPHKITVRAWRNPHSYVGGASIVLDIANNSPTRVLVAGGYGLYIYNNSEMYDPSARTFSPGATMETARSSHTATRLLDGKVLFTGGIVGTQGEGPTGLAELYDPSSETFSATGNMVDPRFGHTATLLDSGRILVAGGADGMSVIPRAEVYDPTTGLFSSSGKMTVPRLGHTAVLLPSGSVLVAGGVDDHLTTLSSAEIYDPTADTFTSIDSMLNPRIGHTMTTLANGQVLITGGAGNLAEIFDPDLNSFTSTGTMTVSRQMHTATLLNNGAVLIAGGLYDSNLRTSTAELYDMDSGSFSPTGTMSAARAGHTATLLADGNVLITGGGSYSAEIYNPNTGTFARTAGNPIWRRAGGPSATLVH